MPFPALTSLTAGAVLMLQMVLAALTSGARGTTRSWVGDGGDAGLLRIIRRHGNLAENSGLFLAGFTLLEMSRLNPTLLEVFCATFVALRIVHAIGLSLKTTNNVMRLAGGGGTYLLGLGLGGALLHAGVTAVHLGRALG